MPGIAGVIYHHVALRTFPRPPRHEAIKLNESIKPGALPVGLGVLTTSEEGEEAHWINNCDRCAVQQQQGHLARSHC